MSARTVDWAELRNARTGTPQPVGLRERKKLLMRQQLTDTATELFVARGFDAVRVAEIAEACGVSEKTVFNYFPTKESLILDQPVTALAALRAELARPGSTPVAAMRTILADELGAITSWLARQGDPIRAIAHYRRFGALIQSTPALRAYQRDMVDQLVTVAAETLAERDGMRPDEPEPQIAATAIVGLWPIQFRSLARHLDAARTPAQIAAAVTDDVDRAARLIDAGLATLAVVRR